MYYYKVKENEVFKYKVLFSIEKIRELQKELINNCAIEEKHEYISYGVPFREKGINYKKFNYEFIGVKEDFYGDWELYKVNVIKYVNPYLYDLIEKILRGDVLALEELFSRKIEMNKENTVKDIDYYYNAFQHLFGVILVDKIDMETYKRIMEFAGLPVSENKEGYEMILNRTK